MATHSSSLAWRITRTEEHASLPSTGSQRVMTEVTEHSTSFSVLSCSTFFLSLDLKLVSYRQQIVISYIFILSANLLSGEFNPFTCNY